MPVLDIITYPNPILKKRSSEVENIDDAILELIDNMAETMYEAPGVGLAAPQVGCSMRVIVVDVEHNDEGKKNLIEMINPVITQSHGSIKSEEACLSIPGFTAEIVRKAEIMVEGIDRSGKDISFEANDLLSRVIQHEIDHLDGVLFIDRLSRLQRELMKNKVKRAFTNRS